MMMTPLSAEKYRDHGENRWFFFTRRERKHEGGKRPNRTTPGGGHWNATGTWRLIYADGELVGCVGTQVFYETLRKKKKGDEVAEEEDSGKTHWTMYEYESLTSMAQYQANRKGEGNVSRLRLYLQQPFVSSPVETVTSAAACWLNLIYSCMYVEG
jgi:hypothetical protein